MCIPCPLPKILEIMSNYLQRVLDDAKKLVTVSDYHTDLLRYTHIKRACGELKGLFTYTMLVDQLRQNGHNYRRAQIFDALIIMQSGGKLIEVGTAKVGNEEVGLFKYDPS